MSYIIFRNGHPVNAYPQKPLEKLGLSPDAQVISEELAQLDCYTFIDSDMPSFDCNLFYPVENWEIRGTECIRTWTLGDQDYSEAWTYVKNIRNQKLAECDWTMTSDAPLTNEQKQAWMDYRIALRDLPQSFDKPQSVVWPVPPS